jgi:hypothetical protein
LKKIILDLCGGSGAWSRPYLEAGYDVRIISLPEHDVRNFNPPPGVWGILAAPPCTHFSFVRRGKVESNHGLRDISAGMEIVNACLSIIQAKCRWWKWWAMENPVGYLNQQPGWTHPRFIYQPWEFGDPWTKRTAIWGRFNSPKKIYTRWEDVPKNDKLYIRKPRKKPNMVWFHKSAYDLIPSYHGLPRPTTDAAFRAMTPQGFARAFFEANP